MTGTPSATKFAILKAANRLFYENGVRTVSMDAVAEAAGVTKKTLYYHFRSKDDLICAYLEARDQPNVRAFEKWFERAEGDLPERIEALFVQLARSGAKRKWKGCGFLRTVAELVDQPGHPAVKAASAHKKNLESWLAGTLEQNGAVDPANLARQIALLLDGALSAMIVHRDAAYVESAGVAARTLVALQRPQDQAATATQ